MRSYEIIYQFSKKLPIDQVEKIGAIQVLQAFLDELAETERRKSSAKIETRSDAMRIKMLMETPCSKYKTMVVLNRHQHSWQKFDFVPSNLGRGFIFYFICHHCDGRVRHLYRPDPEFPLACRRHYRLVYRRPRRQHGNVSGSEIGKNGSSTLTT